MGSDSLVRSLLSADVTSGLFGLQTFWQADLLCRYYCGESMFKLTGLNVCAIDILPYYFIFKDLIL